MFPRRAPAGAIGIVLWVACAGPQPLTEDGAAAYEASLAPTEEGFVVAWHDSRGSPSTLRALRIDPGGHPLGSELRLTEGPDSAWEADVEGVGDGFSVAWYEPPRGGLDRALVGRFAATGEALWLRVVSAADRNGRNPVLLGSERGVFVTWLERQEGGADVWARLLDADGRDLGPAIKIAPAGPTTWNLNAARDPEGHIWVVFDASFGTRADELFAARLVAEAGSLETLGVDRLTSDDGFDSKYPDLAFGDGKLALTWSDRRNGNREVYLYTGSTDEVAAGVDDHAHRITNTETPSIGAYLAWNGELFGLAWSGSESGNYEIYFRSFSSAGEPVGEVRRLTRNSTASLIPAIEPWRDGFVLVWNEDVEEERTSHLVGGRADVVFSFVGR